MEVKTDEYSFARTDGYCVGDAYPASVGGRISQSRQRRWNVPLGGIRTEFQLSEASQKFTRLRGRQRRAHRWAARLSRRAPVLFAHWQMVRGGSVVGAV